MSETLSSTPAGWYPDQATAHRVRYWSGTAWTEHRATAHQSERTYWMRYRDRYPVLAAVFGPIGVWVGFLGSISQPIPVGGSYSYALGHAIGTAIMLMLIMFVVALVVNLLVAIID